MAKIRARRRKKDAVAEGQTADSNRSNRADSAANRSPRDAEDSENVKRLYERLQREQ